MKRFAFCLGTLMSLIIPMSAFAASTRAVLYKNPQCGCCELYADYLRKNGFEVDVKPSNDLAEISRKAGVTEKLKSCHTMFLENYVVEGHIPVNNINQLLAERPQIAGIALPGMPAGSPGMAGRKGEPFTIYAIQKDGSAPTIHVVD